MEFDQTDLVNDYHTGVNTRQRLVLRDETAWANFWSQVVANRMPQPPLPEVNFASEMVVAAAMGSRPTGGYSIVIDALYEADGRLYVVVRETSPGASCVTTQAVTAPLSAVRIPRFEGEVVFSEKTETHECQ